MFHNFRLCLNDLLLVYGKADGPRGMYENWDFNQDGKITVNEVRIKKTNVCSLS